MSIFDKPPVVLELGGHTIKAGFASDNHPVSMFRNLVARPRGLQGLYGLSQDYDVFIGDKAVEKGENLNLSSPILNGKIVNWDNIERVWHHVYYRELKVAPEDRAVLMACSPAMTMFEKIRCCQVFYEVLNCPALCIQPSAVLALYGSGLTTGITVDMGYDSVNINPVYEGGLVKYAQSSTGYAARQAAGYIQNSLAERNIDFGYHNPYVMDEIIQKAIYVTKDIAVPKNINEYKRYFQSPKGELDVSDESFMAGEMFFQPDLVIGHDSGYKGLQTALEESILKCDNDLRVELVKGIVMAGGLSMIPGMGTRLQLDVEKIMSRTVNVLTTDESYSVAWMGGSAFAGIPDAQHMFVTKKQYEDYGQRIIRNRFV